MKNSAVFKFALGGIFSKNIFCLRIQRAIMLMVDLDKINAQILHIIATNLLYLD